MRQLHATIAGFLDRSLGRYLRTYAESLDAPQVVDSATYSVLPLVRVVSSGGAFQCYIPAKLSIRLSADTAYADLPFGDLLALWGSVAALWINDRGQTLDDGPPPMTIVRGSDISDDWLITLQWVFLSAQTPIIEPATVTPDPDSVVIGGGQISVGLWRSPSGTVDNRNDDFLDALIP
jgi:hypothetical protein